MNRHLLYLIVTILIAFNFVSIRTMAQKIRPIRDDVGFCWKTEEISTLTKYLDENSSASGQDKQNFIAGISPHDDYLYAGNVYYPLFKNIKPKEVVIFGVTHGTVRKEIKDPQNIIILDQFDKWKGPLGPVKVSPLRAVIKEKLREQYYDINNKAHILEHSIEAMIPFLQYKNIDVKITPIMITGMPYSRMDSISNELSDIISSYIKASKLKLGEDIFFLISSDASHYGADFNNVPYGDDEAAHKTATDNDKRIASTYFNGTLDNTKVEKLTHELWGQNPDGKAALSWCGRYSIPFGLLTTIKVVDKTGQKHLDGKLLKYSDTWTEGVIPIKHTNLGLTAPFSLKHWVGFLSAGFYLK